MLDINNSIIKIMYVFVIIYIPVFSKKKILKQVNIKLNNIIVLYYLNISKKLDPIDPDLVIDNVCL